MEISIHRALGELNLLDKKIEKKVKGEFIAVKKGTDKKVGGRLVTEIESSITSNFESVNDLFDNPSSEKISSSKIIQSNAVTKVNVNGDEMTVAEAIDRKSSIGYNKALLASLEAQYNRANANVLNGNEDVDDRAEDYIKGLYSDKTQVDTTKIVNLKADFVKENKLDLIDPANIKEESEKIREYIDGFETEVDYVLSESNAVTFIEV